MRGTDKGLTAVLTSAEFSVSFARSQGIKQDLRKLVWHQPSDGLPENLSLVVEAFDCDEDLAQAVRLDNVGLPFQGKPPRNLNC